MFGDLNDLLAAGRLREVEFSASLVGDWEDETEAKSILAVVADRLAVALEVPQILVEKNFREKRVGLLDERSVHLDNSLMDLRVNSDKVAIRSLGVEEDVPTARLNRRSHDPGTEPGVLGASGSSPAASKFDSGTICRAERLPDEARDRR